MELDPVQESRRLEAVRALGLLDTEPESEFDEIVELAAAICGTNIGLMTLIDEDRQFLKSRIGVDLVQTARGDAFCNYTIQQDDVLVIEDAQLDDRFRENRYVQGEPNVRFYAGAPLTTTSGERVGSLCVIDTVPRQLTASQRSALTILSRQIAVRMELRTRRLALSKLANDLQASRDLFRDFANAVPVEAYLKDSEGRIVFYNERLAQRFKVNTTEWIGKTSYDLWNKQTADHIWLEEQHVLRTGRTSELYAEVPDGDDKPSYWKNVRVPCPQTNGETLLACISIDMTRELERERQLQVMQDELESANRKLQALSITDELTGLWNRRAFEVRLVEELSNANRANSSLAMVMMDVDNFKSVNDSFGHPYGDKVLQQIAQIVTETKRTSDTATRYGGEEFALLLPRADAEAAQRACTRLLNAIGTHAWEKRGVTVSMGIAVWDGTENGESLVGRADKALYAAKNAGKGCWSMAPTQVAAAKQVEKTVS